MVFSLMTSAPLTKSQKNCHSTHNFNHSPCCAINLGDLPPEVLMKIAKFAQESLLNLHLTCKKIDESMRRSVARAKFGDIWGKFASDKYPFVFPNSKRYPHLRQIELFKDDRKGVDFTIINSAAAHLNLQSMTIRDCAIPYYRPKAIASDRFINTLSKCSELRALHLDSCSLISNEAWQNLFKSLPNLQKLRLSSAKLISIDGLSSKHLSNLKTLALNGCSELTDQFLGQILYAASHLEDLKIFYCNLSGSAFAHLTSHEICKIKLDVCHCEEVVVQNGQEKKVHCSQKIDIALFQFLLKKSSNLKELFLSYSGKDHMFSDLQNQAQIDLHLSNLHTLNLSDLDMREVSWLIRVSPNLKRMNFWICNHFENVINSAAISLKCLQSSEIASCDIDNELFAKIISGTDELTALTVQQCHKISNRAWEKTNFSRLLAFTFEYCEYPEDEAPYDINSQELANIAKRAPQLENLHINGEDCIGVDEDESDEEQFEHLEGTLQNLKSLYISKSNSWSNAKVLNLLNRSHQIENVSLHGFESITDEIVHHLLKHYPKLKKLRVHNCSKISEEVVNLTYTVFGKKLPTFC